MAIPREELIEVLGVHLEAEHKLPPLAARIYGMLILAQPDGLTFEDCLDRLGASKSSVSTSLNLLLSMGIISYFTKHGDRRRHFSSTKEKNYFLTKLKENLKRLEAEKNIITLLVDHFSNNNPKKLEKGAAKIDLYLNYINLNRELLEDSITKLENIEEQLT